MFSNGDLREDHKVTLEEGRGWREVCKYLLETTTLLLFSIDHRDLVKHKEFGSMYTILALTICVLCSS